MTPTNILNHQYNNNPLTTIITSTSTMTEVFQSVIAGLRAEVEERLDHPHTKQHRGIVTHLKPMDTIAEQYLATRNVRLGTWSFNSDARRENWGLLLTKLSDDNLNSLLPYIHPSSHTGNKEMVILSNVHSLSRLLNLNESTVDSLIGHHTTFFTHDAYVVCGTVVRTNQSLCNPELLMGRTWNEIVPSEEDLNINVDAVHSGVNPDAGNIVTPVDDAAMIPVMRMNDPPGMYAYQSSSVPRRLFHVGEMNSSWSHNRWNSISIIWTRTNGDDGRLTVHIPGVVYGKTHSHGQLSDNVDAIKHLFLNS